MNRKIRTLLLACVLMLTLCACGKEQKVIRAIRSIGTVSMKSVEKIERAEELYAQLDDAARAGISNVDTLTQARAEYDRQKALIDKALDAVSAITTAGDTVTAAREAFDAAAQYDTTGLLEEAEQTLLAAEAGLREKIAGAEALTAELDALYEAGSYTEVETLAAPYIQDLPAGELKTRLGTVVVEALCAQARERYDGGDCMSAMTLLKRCADYEDSCDTGVMAQCEIQRQSYITAMSRSAPASGTILDRTYNAGRNTFTITVGSTDTCVKLELIDDPTKYVTFYVRANDTVKVSLLNGTYRVKYTTGEVWYDETNMFGSDATYLVLKETVELAGYTTATHVYWHTVTCTLYTGYDEDLGIQNMDPGDF